MATSAGTIPISATFNGAQLEKDVLSALNRIQNKSTLNLNTRNFTQPLGKITGLANEFNKSLEASNARVVAFGASAGLIFAVQKSFTALVASTIEVEKSLTDINIVLNTSSKGIKQFGDQLFDVARQTGAAFKDVAGAATEFSRQGLGLEETLKRTRDALILTRLSGLDVVSSTEALTAAVNSFTKEALTTTDVVNKLAAVDAKFAVSSRDLSEALQRVGSSASEAGVSFDELLGIVTSVQQTTARGGAVIGNALKTIFTRIERPQVISDLRDFGVAVTDISGNALPTIKVIENLAQSFQNLNPVVKSQVAELVGGVYQINILKAALADVSKQNSAFAEATRTSSKAADEAIIKNDALNKSLSALINETTVNFTQFASKIGDVSIAPGIRKVLNNIVNPALESFNNKEVEGVGAKIATGLLTGLTDFITGPGLGLGALAIGKLIANFTGFAGDAAKNLLGVGKDQAIIQGEISKILSSNPQLIQQIIAGSKSRLQVEKEIKQILIEQAAISKSIKDNSKDITGRFLASGLTVSPETGLIGGRRSAGGYIPAKQQAAEMIGAMQGGYAPGKVVAAPKSIGGIMNTAETVKYVPGFAQPYILPPQGSRAARDLTSRSMSKNGINPYKARGFVPNFAPRSLENPSYGDNDWWFDSGLKSPASLSQIQTGTAAAWSSDKGFFRTDGKRFTANDLNTFIRRGASYGDIRRYLPDSFFQDDPRLKAGVSIEQLRREYKPGAKIATTESVKEEVRRVFEPYTPPASMLIWDLAGKNNNQDEIVDLEKLTGEKKQAGRSYKIKIRALSGSALNEEKFGLVDKTSKFARDITKKLASGIPGAKSDYSDAEVDDFFNKTGKNYSVLAGTIFEAGTNLAASYVRDRSFRGSMGRSGSGGDFDVMGGSNLSNVQKFFPGFTDSYGDYKLNNSYDSMREFIAKVEKEFPVEISNHFAKQESKIAGITTSARGFIPNFAQKDFQTVNTARLMGINLAQMDINPETVFRESLQNAIAHGQSGQEKGIFLATSSYGKPSEFAISDLGTGMSPEDVLTKFLPYAQTGNEAGNKGLSGFGMGKASIFMGSKKFLLDTIKEINGKKIRTIVSGNPEGWNNFIQQGKISLDENLFSQPNGSLNLNGLKMFWREVDPEKRNTPVMGTTFAASPSKQDYISYLNYSKQRAGKIAEIPFGTTSYSNVMQEAMRARYATPRYRSNSFYETVANKASVQKTLTAKGGEVDLLFDPQGDPERTYGYAQIPMLSEGMRYASFKAEGIDYLPKNLMFNIRSNVDASSPDYPWNTDRTELRGPLGTMAKSAVMDLAKQIKEAQESSVRNVPSYQMGSGLELLDVSSSLSKEKMESIAGNPKFQNFGAALKSVFEQTVGQAADIFDPRMANASFRGLAVGANWMGLNTSSSKEVGTKSIVEPFAHIETVIERIKKISQEKAKQGKKIGRVGKFRDIYSRELLDTVFHEAAHQVNRTEGEAHAKSMASVWAANAEQVGEYLKQIQDSLDPELMNFIISTYKQNKSVIDQGKGEKFKEFISKYSLGHIPNFAKAQLGKPGFFGAFSALRGSLGVKEFANPNKSTTKASVANEYLSGQELGQMIGAEQLNPVFETPKIYGSIEKAIKKSAIYKEIFSGKTADQIAENLDQYTGERQGFVQLAEIIAERATAQINAGGRMQAVDLTQNLGNMMYNQVAENILSKISRRNYEKLLSSIASKNNQDAEAQVDRILSSIFTKGGKVSIVDVGRFDLGRGLTSQRTSALNKLGYSDEYMFSSGHVPNFNPVQEAMGREMAAGYSSSQVRLGQSNKLRTSFNPMGLGVYNSTEGSLNNGIGLAEKAGINPKTKGMSAKGHIPNFAESAGFDLFAMTAAFSALIFSARQTAQSLKELKDTNEKLKKDYTSAAGSYAQQMGQLPKDFKKRQQQIGDEIENTFTNINRTTLKLKGTSTAPLVMGPPTRDKFGIITRSPQAASPEQLARLQELRDQLAEEIKKTREGRRSAREAMKEAGAGARAMDAPYFGKGMFAQNSKLSGLLKAVGPGAAVGVSTLLSVGSQFIPEKNKQARAAVSGVSDIAQYTGTGAAFGAPGAAVGFLVGLGFALKKLSDAKAEEAIDKINDSLNTTKEKAAEFSGAAQNYASSLESLQSALNDPKTRPDALLRFQNNLSEALNSIPKEFRNKVLSAGTDINKITEAISNINKEIGNTQKNLERQLAITSLIKESSSILGPASVSAKNQKALNALFSSSINAEAVNKNFAGGEDFGKFIDSLKVQITKNTTTPIPTYGPTGVTQMQITKPSLNKEALEDVKAQLKQKGVLSDTIVSQLDEAFAQLDLTAVQSIFDDLKKSGIIITDNSKRSKILGEILQENTKRVNENAEAIKELNSQYNDINLQISNQIDIEKNRAKTIREINKIQAEGTVSVQRAKVKGLLDVASPFISEGAKNEIQGQIDINEITTRQSSKIQEASNKVLDSFTDILTKRAEEARSTIIPAIEGAKDDKAIQKERSVFQQQIQKLTPLITESIKEINRGGNIGDIQQNLISQITAFPGFKSEQKNVLVQAIESSFSDFQNTLAEIKAQGDIDLRIQEAQREYQKQSLALNQRLSFAGGAQALGSTGKAGVSDLFDNVSELVSELRQTNTIGNAAQRGSSAFKLLDVLTNQLQLNRAVQAPVPFRDAQNFNAQVSSDLGPLVGTAIAGRVQQIREGVDLARRVTEIQTGKPTAGTALGTAFDQAKEGAVRTALDQIASQFKLENMGSYLDVLQKEAQFLNDLTQDQNEILAETLPTSINDNFKTVIESEVGARLDSLTRSLTDVVNKLSINTRTNILESERQNLLPVIGTEFRKDILQTIISAGPLKDIAPGIPIASMRDRSDLEYRGSLITPLDPRVLEGTYEKLARDLTEKYKSQLGDQVITAEQIKSIQAKNNEITNALKAPPLMSGNEQSQFGPFAGGYDNPFAASTAAKAGAQFNPRAISNALATARSNQKRLDDLFINRLETDKDLIDLNERVNNLLKQDAADTQKREELIKLQTELRAKTLEQENKIAKEQFDLYYKSGFGKTFFRDEKAAQANALIESEARQGNIDYKSITEKNTTYNRADFARDTGQLIDTFQTDFKSGIASAFGEAIKGTKTLKDAFRDMFQNILNRILDKSLEMGVDALFAFGKAAATGRKDGGLIRGYNSGGMVVGGSGMKDDVPAMMSGGEYVIKKSSVNKYGANYLRALNGGLVPRYATGGFSIGPLQNEFLYDNPERPTSGEYAVDSRLSAMALTDENNPQNRLREDRFNKLDQYLQDRAQYEKDKQQAIKNYKNQVNSTFYSGLAAAGIQLGTAGLTIGAEKLRTPKATVGKPYQAYSPTFSNYTGGKRANGGYIPKFAGGGYTGKDNIPALLMGGEYVMNKKSVDMYGRDFMSQLNSGTLPKYATGGMVGTSYTGQGNPQTSIEELVTALNTLNENLSKDNGITQAESGKVSAAGVTQESGMSVVNNISINVSQGGEVTSEANSTTQQGKTNTQNSQNNIQNNAKLGELLRNKVVEVLVEQKRPGGLLYASR